MGQRLDALSAPALTAASSIGADGVDGTVPGLARWVAPVGQHVCAADRFAVLGPFPSATCLRLDLQRRRLVVGHADNVVRVFEARHADAPFELRQTLVGHTGAVLCVQFDSARVVSAGRDGAVKVRGIAVDAARARTPVRLQANERCSRARGRFSWHADRPSCGR